MTRMRILTVVAALLAALTAPVRGVTLDWNNVAWTSESLTGYFELDSSNPGVDLSITITGQTGDFLTLLPIDYNFLTGGQGTAQESLWLGVNHDQRSDTVTVTVNFHYAQGVTGVNFMLFDIDRDSSSGADVGYRDLITGIYAQYNSGTPKAPTITDGSANSKTGSTTNQTILGDSSADDDAATGNATINYGTNIINSFTFTYGNHSTAPSDPGYQWIGLYDVNFTPRARLPETGTSVAAAGMCLLGIVFAHRRLRKQRSPDAVRLCE